MLSTYIGLVMVSITIARRCTSGLFKTNCVPFSVRKKATFERPEAAQGSIMAQRATHVPWGGLWTPKRSLGGLRPPKISLGGVWQPKSLFFLTEKDIESVEDI